MHITLDEEQWQLPDETSVMEVLAAISDKARAQHRIVTSLTIGGNAINDRDLIGDARAASKSFHCIITEAKQAIGRFAAQLRTDGQGLLIPLRSGTGQVGSIDAWCGRLADYMEMLEAGAKQGVDGLTPAPLLPWIQELLGARTNADPIRVADLLEYELLPLLTDPTLAA
jgi:hypothetical protein